MHAEHANSDKLNDLSGRVIGCAFTVLNTLGTGFLETVYENALALELRASGLAVVQQHTAQECITMTRWSASTSWTCWSRTYFWLN
jgi:PD-(D/E)XK nuclease superfamily protein